MISLALDQPRGPEDEQEFAVELGNFIASWSGRISVGEIVGVLEIHKIQILIHNAPQKPDSDSNG